jgi:urea transport system ATP-binding protein
MPVSHATANRLPSASAGHTGVAGSHVLESGRVDTSHGVILYLEDITVSFDGFRALNELSLTVDKGELRCIIGPNGAGKTTMMDVITGKTRPDAGSAFFGQTIDLLRTSETDIAILGIGRKFQKPTVFENHSVQENLELARKGRRRLRDCIRSRSDSLNDRVDETLEIISLESVAYRQAGTLSHGQKQWLEIGMLLVQDPELILLDEPVAGMTDAETERTGELILKLRERHSIIVVEHDMDFVAQLASKVTVLHEGSVLAEGQLDEVQRNDRVIEVYLGR